MGRHNYNSIFNQGEVIIEIRILDPAGNKLDAMRCKISDQVSLLKNLRIIKSKYGVAIEDDWLSIDNDFLKF